MFTFLHAADIHLDSPLRGLDRYEGAPVDEIRGATRKALVKLVDLAIREDVAFVVLAGDLYDGDWKDFDTGLFFVSQMSRLREAEIPVFGVYGNHDAASKITRSLRLPDNVTFFPTAAAETHRLDSLDVALHGQSFARQCTTADLAKDYPAPVSGCFNLGILHTSMAGKEGHDRYAPCSESCLRDSGYDYWALGHIHQREVLPGEPTIAYPGNIQGRHIREAGPKGCLLVQVDEENSVTTRFESLDVLRWGVAEVSLEGAEDKTEALERIADALRQAVEGAEGRLTATRLVLRGKTSLADLIAVELKQWTADVRAVGLDLGTDRLWVERVKNKTTRPTATEASGHDDSPLLEVTKIVAELSGASSVAEDLGFDLSDLLRKLPTELKNAVKTSDAEWWCEVLRDAEAKLLSELRG